jgi:hypothetical protein
LAEEIMARISSPAARIAVVAALLVSGIGVGLPIDSTRAGDSDSTRAGNNCATAPGAAAPVGQHWYYHVDREKHRKCWYLHAALPLANHVAAVHRATASQPVPAVATPQSPSGATPIATNAASTPQPAADSSNPPSEIAITQPAPHVTVHTVKTVTANPPGEAASAQPAPHVTVLTVKTVSAPFVGTTSASQATVPEQTAKPPMPQIAPGDASTPVDGIGKANRADSATVPAAPDTAQNALAPPRTAATDAAVAHAAPLFFLLVGLALAIAAALIGLFGKTSSLMGTPRLSHHPDDAWRRYRTAHPQADQAVFDEEDAPFLAPPEPPEPVDLDAHAWIEQSPPAQPDFSVPRPQDGERAQSQQIVPTLKDVELALRVLRQARQGVTRT